MPSPNDTSNNSSTGVRLNWTQIAAHPDPKHGLPLARSSHGVSYIAGAADTLVVYGGEHVARTPLPAEQALWACVNVSSASPTWKCLSAAAAAAAPPPRIAHAQAVVQDRYVYIFGGRAGITMQEQAMNDLWRLDTVDWSWTQIETTSTKPPARSFHRMVAVDDRFLFVFGGCGAEGRLNDLWKFDCTTKEWHSLGSSPLLKGRGGPNLLCLGGRDDQSCERIAVIAGFAGEETNDGHAYHLAQEQWDEQALSGLSELRPRSVCGAATLRDYAVLVGGEVDPSAKGHAGAGGFENDVVLLDRRTGALLQTISQANQNKSKEDTTTTGSSVPWPAPRGWADCSAVPGPSTAGSTTGNVLLLFGGLTGDDEHPVRLQDLWRLEIDNSSGG